MKATHVGVAKLTIVCTPTVSSEAAMKATHVGVAKVDLNWYGDTVEFAAMKATHVGVAKVTTADTVTVSMTPPQ